MNKTNIRNLLTATALSVTIGAGVAPQALAEWAFGVSPNGKSIEVNISAQPVDSALNKLAALSGLQIVLYTDLIEGVISKAVIGEFNNEEEVLRLLLADTGLGYEYLNERTVSIHADSETAQDTAVIGKSINSDRSTRERIEEAGNRELEEMIVTAQKRVQNIYDVPMSITAIGGEELEERGITSLEDLGLSVPGLSVVDSGIIRDVNLRGLGNAFGASSLVGIYIDEVPTAITGFKSEKLDIRAYDLERVEVLRGPQGTLYGQGSTGGTIRFVTKKPDLDRFIFKADIAASFTEDGAPSEKLQGVINLPVVTDTFGLRMAVTFEDSGGWVDQPSTARNNLNDRDKTSIRVKGLWRPVEELSVDLMADIHRGQGNLVAFTEGDQGNLIEHGVSAPPSVINKDDHDIYNLTLTYDLDTVQLISASSYIKSEKEFRNIVLAYPILPPPAAPFTFVVDDFYDADAFSQELRFSSAGTGPWQWTVGGFYQDSRGALEEAVFAFNVEETSKSWAIFGNSSVMLAERLELGVGLRYFEDDRAQIDRLTGNSQTDTFDTLNPRLYANFDLTDSVKVYASAAKGFRSGGFNGTTGQPSYDPENLWSYEFGTKMSLWDGLVEGEVSAFYSEWTDFIITGTDPVTLQNILDNAGDAEIKGLDWALAWRPSDSLEIVFNGSYIDTEVVKIELLSSPFAVGDPVDFIAPYQFTLSAIQDFDWNGRPGYARVDYNQTGKSYRRFRNFGPHFVSTSDVINLLNARVGWQWNENLSVGVFASNLLNERGFIDPNSIFNVGVRSRPRTIGIEFGVEFY